MKRETFRHPKTLDLAARLGVDRRSAIATLMLLWDYTGDVAPQGNIGKWSDAAIAAACDWTGDVSIFINALIGSGWLDCDDQLRLVIHDWPDHCEDFVRAKLSRLKKGFCECYGRNAGDSVYKRRSDSVATPEQQRSIDGAVIPSRPFPSLPVQSSSSSSTTNLGTKNEGEHASDDQATRERSSERDPAWETIYREYFLPAAKAICRDGQPLGLELREAVLKASFLAATKFDKEWLLRGCKTTKRKAKSNPPAFLGSTLAKQAGMEPEEYFRMADVIRLSDCGKAPT
jgi:hypothetical protein